MSMSFLADAFGHHVWATLRLIDSCFALSPEQLGTTLPGTYGSILETMRHLVGGDSFYLFIASAERTPLIEEEQMGLAEVRNAMEANGAAWSRLLGEDLDPDAVLRDVDEEGYERHTPMGILLAQALHHGSDHRSQVCTALTALGVEAPDIDVWAFGLQHARVIEHPPAL